MIMRDDEMKHHAESGMPLHGDGTENSDKLSPKCLLTYKHADKATRIYKHSLHTQPANIHDICTCTIPSGYGMKVVENLVPSKTLAPLCKDHVVNNGDKSVAVRRLKLVKYP